MALDIMKRLIPILVAMLSGTAMAQDGDMVVLKLSNIATAATPTSVTSQTIREGYVKRIVLDVGLVGVDATFQVLLTNAVMGNTYTLYSGALTTNLDIFPMVACNETSGARATNLYTRIPIFRDAVVFRAYSAAATNKNASAYITWTSEP